MRSLASSSPLLDKKIQRLLFSETQQKFSCHFDLSTASKQYTQNKVFKSILNTINTNNFEDFQTVAKQYTQSKIFKNSLPLLKEGNDLPVVQGFDIESQLKNNKPKQVISYEVFKNDIQRITQLPVSDPILKDVYKNFFKQPTNEDTIKPQALFNVGLDTEQYASFTGLVEQLMSTLRQFGSTIATSASTGLKVEHSISSQQYFPALLCLVACVVIPEVVRLDSSKLKICLIGIGMISALVGLVHAYDFIKAKVARIWPQNKLDVADFSFLGEFMFNVLTAGAAIKSTKNTWEACSKFLSANDAGSKRTANLVEHLLTTFQRIVNFICGDLMGVSSPQFVDLDGDVYKQFIKRVVVLEKAHIANTLPYTTETYDNLVTEYYIGRGLVVDNTNGQLRTGLSMHLNALEKLMAIYSSGTSFNQQLRVPPLGIYLFGSSGTGKTSVGGMLGGELYASRCTSEQFKYFVDKPEKLVYPWPLGEQYAEGYTFQPVVSLDDLFQCDNEFEGSSSSAGLIIKMINSAPFPIAKASVEAKGKFYFNARYVIATSNDANLRPRDVVSPEAIQRRFRVIAKVYPKEEFSLIKSTDVNVRRIDRVKADAHFKNGGAYTDVYEFATYYSQGGFLVATGQTYDWSRFITFCREQDQLNIAAGEKYLAQFTSNNARLLKTKEAFENKFLVENQYVPPTTKPQVSWLFGGGWETTNQSDNRDYGSNPSPSTPEVSLPVTPDSGEGTGFNTPLRDESVEIIESISEPDTAIFQVPVKKVTFEEATKINAFKALGFNKVLRGDESPEYIEKLHRLADRIVKRPMNSFTKTEDWGATDPSFADAARKFLGMYKPLFVAMEPDIYDALVENFIKAPHYKYDPLTNGPSFFAYIIEQGHTVPEEAFNYVPLETGWLDKVIFTADRLIQNGLQLLMDGRKSLLTKFPTLYAALSIMSLVALLTAYYVGIYKVTKFLTSSVSSYFSKDKNDEKSEDEYEVDLSTTSQSGNHHVKGKRHKVKLIRRASYRDPQETTTQNRDFIPPVEYKEKGVKSNNTEAFVSLLRNNFVSVFVKRGSTWYDVGSGLFIHGTNLVLPAHYYSKFLKYDDDTKFLLVSIGQNASDIAHSGYSKEEFLKTPPTSIDVVKDLWCFPIGTVSHRDITDHFLTEKQILDLFEQNKTLQGEFFVPRGEEIFVDKTFVFKKGATKYQSDGVNYDLHLPIGYQATTEDGDCGSLLMLDNGSKSGIILSMHVALSGYSDAIGTALTQEWVKSKRPLKPNVRDLVSPLAGSTGETFMDFNVVRRLGTEPGFPRVKTSSKTKLRPTQANIDKVLGESSKKPAVLAPIVKDGVLINPYDKSLENFTGPNIEIPEKLLRTAVLDYQKRIIHYVHAEKTVGKRILTFEEAVTGVKGSKYCRRIATNTSAGYPWSTMTTLKGKKEFFGEGEFLDLTTPLALMMREVVEEMIEKAKQGIRSAVIWCNNLKDELRSLQKVEDVKTRLFSGSPLHYTIVFKMFFGSFASAMMQHRLVNGSAVGINPFDEEEWRSLFKRITSKGPHVVGGDFTLFDATQSACALNSIVDIINAWYDDGDENALIRKVLWAEVSNSFHAHGEFLLEYDHSLPSGHPLTTIINSMYVNIVMRIAWIICHNYNTESIEKFDEEVELIANGDDNLLGICSKVIEIFNYQTIQQSLSTIGLFYTDEAKSKILPLSKTIQEVTFLKRGFRLTKQGEISAPIDLETIISLCYWYRTGENPGMYERVHENLVNAMRELSHHSPEVFECYSNKIRRISDQHNMHLPYRNREEWREDARESFEASFDRNPNIVVQSSGIGTEMNDLAPEGRSNTVMLNDTEATEYKPIVFRSMQTGLEAGTKSVKKNDIQEFLACPMLLATISMTSAYAADTSLGSLEVPFDPAFPVPLAEVKNKLRGYGGFTGKCRITIQVNADPMTQGMLLCHYIPMASSNSLIDNHNSSLVTKTQQPRVELNFAKQTSVDMVLPKVGPMPYYDLLTGNGAWGTLYFTVYSPLIGNSVNFTVWMSFEEVEPVIATSIVPQMKDPSAREKKASGKGPISSSIKMVGGGVSQVLRHVPGLSVVAGVTDMASEILSGAFSLFGFSDAINNSPDEATTSSSGRYRLTADGISNAIPMGLTMTSQLTHLPGFDGGEEDQLALNYVKKKFAWFMTINWATSAATGTILATTPVSPMSFMKNVVVDGITFTDLTPVAMIGSFFRRWAGGFIFRIIFVKTKFQTGRLQVAFVPTDGTQPTNLGMESYASKVVIDVEENTTEILLHVPYVSLYPLLRDKDVMGTLFFSVATPLRASTTVANNINVIVEVCGDDELRFGSLSRRILVPAKIVPSTEEPKRLPPASFVPDIRIKPQAGNVPDVGTSNAENLDQETKMVEIGNGTSPSDEGAREMYCLGETCLSFRSLLKRFSGVQGWVSNPETFYKTMSMYPYTFGGLKYTVGGGSTQSTWTLDYLSSIAPGYLLYRGSISIMFTGDALKKIRGTGNLASAQARVSIACDGEDLTLPMQGLNLAKEYNNGSICEDIGTYSSNLTVSLPAWQTTHSNLVKISYDDSVPIVFDKTTSDLNLLFSYSQGIDLTQLSIYRKANDDFSFGFFIGYPRCQILKGPVNYAYEE